jgi:hypothetical protein
VHLPTATDQQDPAGLVGDSPLDDISSDVNVYNPSIGNCDPVPLFKLAPGVTGTSHGLACARKGGLPEPVLQRAAELMQLMSGIDSNSSTSSSSGGNSSDKQADRDGSKARAQLAPRALSMLVSATLCCCISSYFELLLASTLSSFCLLPIHTGTAAAITAVPWCSEDHTVVL